MALALLDVLDGISLPSAPSRTSVHRQTHYFLTFCSERRRTPFTNAEVVDLVLTQFLRAASEQHFELTAYLLHADHAHLIISGQADHSDCRAFIKLAKQYSGFYFKKCHGHQLWQRYGFERVIRDEKELAFTIGYVVANPVRAGLVDHPSSTRILGRSVTQSRSS